MQRIAIIIGDAHSYSHDMSSQSAATMFATAATPYAEVQKFNVKDGLDEFWRQAKSFTAIVPLLYPLSANEALVLQELAQRKIPHLFSGFATHATLADRICMKNTLLAAGVKTPRYQIVSSDKNITQFPAVLYALSQPIRGTWLASTKKEFVEILPAVAKYSQKIMAEEYHGGERYSVSVIHDQFNGIRALPPVFLREIPDSERTHYADPYSEPICPANLTSTMRHALQDEAMRAHTAIGARNFSHSLFRVDSAGDHWLTDITHSIVGNDTLYHELMPALREANISDTELLRLWLNA